MVGGSSLEITDFLLLEAYILNILIILILFVGFFVKLVDFRAFFNFSF